jgi:protein-S-isoprenylcysteine O-methyltransferase Ste14
MAGPRSQRAPTSRPGLAVRTVLGFAALAVAIAATVFGPASTFEYWQGWLYLLAFFGSAAAITLYLWRADPSLLERRVSGGPLAEQQASQRVIQSLASLAFISLLVLPSLDHRFGWSNVPAIVTLATDAVVVLAFWIVFLVFRVNTFTAATVGVATGQMVISQGPYRFVRHPMYAGALLMLLATPIALGSWWGLIAFVPMLASIVWRLLAEQELLAHQLSGYADYRARVRYGLLPLVW